ncbi:FHA domain-containing protein [Luteipulveratus sp. YIM 133132]|uniref:FHA domain-containing protein n=1 Tax=Luteipulveratus flavus TaxID=3031728 RepID=A0ABT6C554_9MICO|nr:MULTISPECIES: FHA domain-containing protein [unclassified Luteipulveratus]MDE9364398.1 FHA domain-containing protein [Luteipulveratus sp. YIM 133132]MDF8263963.1 FHA domain-containing protein [Luteipulveratus sp. YIM 133296]
MSELTVTAIRLGLLALLWAFVFSVVGVLRGDLYGTRVLARRGSGGSSTPSRQEERRAPRAIRRGPTHLAVTEGSLRGTTVPLTDAGVLIGRNPECALVLSDDFASGRHARIYRRDDGWYVDDLGSTNGTFAGNQRVGQEFKLDVGSRLRIGQTVLELRK